MALPLVLAGPILRWVSRDKIRVWVAFSEDVTAGGSAALILEVYSAKSLERFVESDDDQRARLAIGTSNAAHVEGVSKLQASERIFLFVLEARPIIDDAFPGDQILAYEVFLQPQSGNQLTRSGLCEHLSYASRAKVAGTPPLYTRGYSDERDYSKSEPPDAATVFLYDARWRPCPLIVTEEGEQYVYPLPTFVVQGDGTDLRLWLASCQKPHGFGSAASVGMYCAAKTKAEGVLTDICADAKQRTHLLALVGDQIYADDVPFCMAEGIRRLYAHFLPNRFEEIPSSTGCELPDLDWKKRRELVGRQSPTGRIETLFNLDDGVENQLFTKLEFLIYYLMHHNPSLWMNLSIPEIVGVQMTTLEHELTSVLRQRQAFLDYQTVLANVAVYSLLDDHEITDDSFFDFDWIDRFENTDTDKSREDVSRFIVSNALFSYEAMQCYGGRPEIQVEISDPSILGTDEALRSQLERMQSYATPTEPPVLFIDTRVVRSIAKRQNAPPSAGTMIYGRKTSLDFDEDGPSSTMPRQVTARRNWLQTKQALDGLLKHALNRSPGRLVIATSSPVLSSDGMAHSKRLASSDAKVLDEEGWRDNLSNYFMLVEALLRAGSTACTVLSGDVHYGFARKATLQRRTHVARLAPSTSVEIEQFVSSPMLNEFQKRIGTLRYDFVLRWFASTFFEDDYRSPTEYLAPGNPWSTAHTWTMGYAGEALNRVAPFLYDEILSEIEVLAPTGGSIKQPIWGNHFLSLTIGAQRTAVCHST